MRGAAAEMPVVYQERRGQAQQRLHRKERDLPALRHRTALQQHPELCLRIARRQIQVILEGGHARRVLSRRPALLRGDRSSFVWLFRHLEPGNCACSIAVVTPIR